MRSFTNLLVLTVILGMNNPGYAHHSFAVHFVPDRIISISGTVTEFRFTNPHGLVFMTVTSETGEEQVWRAETNSPNVLRRRGWNATSIKQGDVVTIEGYPTRDGSKVLRLHRVVFPDGRELPGQGRVLSGPPGED